MVAPNWQIKGTMAFAERIAVMNALAQNSFCISRTARQLRISRSTTYRLIRDYEISVEREELR